MLFGMMFWIYGDVNDYFGKGFFGGKLIVSLDVKIFIKLYDFVIVGNVMFYGVIGGYVYMYGKVGVCFVVWNSGVIVVVEGIGDNGCEYMIGGVVVVFGEIGENFVVGMFGGVVYFYINNK